MCTVTYIPPTESKGFILTSNRDEAAHRKTEVPNLYEKNGMKVCFPKDSKAGGSWIAVNSNDRVCCLLNGAFVAHVKEASYAQSRGQVLLEVASTHDHAEEYFKNKDLNNIEPFTIITIELKAKEVTHFSEFIWDGTKKHFRNPDINKPHIWSSASLYSGENRKERINWFSQFMQEHNGVVTPKNVINFHSGNHTDDNSVNLVMEREGDLKTVSITQITQNGGDNIHMKYYDLIKDTNHCVEI